MRRDIASSSKRFGAFFIDAAVNISVIVAAVFYGDKVGGLNGFFVSIGFLISLLSVKMAFWYESTTLGKSYFNLIVVDKNDGRKIGFKKMILRQTFGTLVSIVILNIGYIWILIDRNRQGWHDKIFNDIVIDEKYFESIRNKDSDDYIQGY